jgi:hypothetical protein
MSRLFLVVAGLFLAGCGRTTYEVLEPPSRPFNAYGSLTGVQVESSVKVSPDSDGVPYTGTLAKVLQERLADEEFWTGQDRPIKVLCKVVGYDYEYSEPKLFGGGGGMIWGKIVLELEFRGDDDRSAGRVRAVGYSKARGWGIASMAAAERRAVQAVVDFIHDNYDAVAPKP